MSDTQILPVPPTALLKIAHLRLHELLDRFAAIEPDETRELRTAFREIREFLQIHLAIEEALFYPAIREGAEGAVDRALEEHLRLKSSLEVLGSSEASPAGFRRSLLDHLEREEVELFPAAHELPLDAQCRLSREMELLQRRLEGRG